jgi:hypothetical protein
MCGICDKSIVIVNRHPTINTLFILPLDNATIHDLRAPTKKSGFSEICWLQRNILRKNPVSELPFPNNIGSTNYSIAPSKLAVVSHLADTRNLPALNGVPLVSSSHSPKVLLAVPGAARCECSASKSSHYRR